MSDDIYYDLHMEGDDEIPKTKGQKIASLFFKSVFWIILAGIMGIFLWRMFSMKEIPMADDFLANDITLGAIEKHKSDEIKPGYSAKGIVFRTFDYLTIEDRKTHTRKDVSLKDFGYDGFQVFTQHLTSYFAKNEETGEFIKDDKTGEYVTINRSEYSDKSTKEDEGNLRVSNMYFIPQSSQVMVTFRYNANAEKTLIKNYPEASKLGENDERFLYVLRDNKGKTYSDYSFLNGSRSNYTYRRLLFDGVDFSGVTLLTLDIYYIGSDDFSQAYRSMVIYDANLTLEEKNITLPKTVTNGMTVTYNKNKED